MLTRFQNRAQSGLLIVLLVSVALLPPCANAQSNEEDVTALRKEVQELRALVEILLEAKPTTIETPAESSKLHHQVLYDTIETLPKRVETSPNDSSLGTNAGESDGIADAFQDVLSDRQPIGRFPDDAFVTAGSFDRSIQVPGTSGSFRVGGAIQVNANYDPDHAGLQFIGGPPTIPLDGTVDDETQQFAIHARHTRVNFDYRAPTDLGQFRTFVEFDFFGDGDEFTNDFDLRLRHAAAELGPLKIGQFWSGFVDVFSLPETADPGGPLAVPILRNPGIYYVSGDRTGSNWGIGIENPAADLGGATDLIASESAPNIVGFGQLKRDWGYIRLAGLGLQLKSDKDSTFTGGANLTGRINTAFTGSSQNNISFGAQYGSGFVHYYSSFIEQLDGIISDDGAVEATEILGAFIGYQHFWTHRWRSTVTASRFDLDQPNGAAPLSFDNSDRFSANLFYTPIDGVTFGLEGIYNDIETFDGSDGEGIRIEFVGRFDF